MHQPNPFHEFEAFEPKRSVGSRAKRITFGLFFTVALATSALAGYELGRGAWSIPVSIAARIPAPLAGWLPAPGGPATSASPPAELTDYAFELVDHQPKQGEAVVIVRLVDKRSGKPVPDAVIFAKRIDMAPEGMPTMTAKLESQPATEPGHYRFKTDLVMEGGWQLSLAAKVQGETGTVQSKLVLKVAP